MSVEIGADQCSCPRGVCAAFCDPPDVCVNRLPGDVRTMACPVCHPDGRGASWHQDGECLRCRHLRRQALDEVARIDREALS